MSGPGQDKPAGAIVALCGGIGGAKLVLGLDRVLSPGALTVIVNTGDDFRHLGLAVSPDVDTVLYTLAGLADVQAGWGRRDETWSFMETLAELGGETWFRLGDRDLALHVERTRRLASGETLSEIIGDISERLGVASRVLPMTDERVATIVETASGALPFQRYFVAEGAAPPVRAIRCEGTETAAPSPQALAALAAPDLAAVVIAPSNPYLSIDPLLAMPGLRQALGGTLAPVIAVSPIVGGEAVKGPTAKIMRELGIPVSPAAIARHYDGLIDGFVLDRHDAAAAQEIDVPVRVEETLMTTLASKTALAEAVLAFAEALRPAKRTRGAA